MSKYIGDVSAYAYAVSKGYTGTEEEFAELMASYASVAQSAAASATAAAGSATSAASSASTASAAATTATTKASEASTSATNAAGSASSAASSATAASGSATSAAASATTASGKASEATTAAGTATTAKNDAVTAKTAAQAAQTAAETAQGKAETAQGAAEDAAESVSASVAQIATNTSDISDLKEDLTTKANTDGYYEDLVSGGSTQLLSDMVETDTTPYNYRTAGGSLEIGDHMRVKEFVGVSLPINQLLNESTNFSATGGTISTTDGVGTFTPSASGQQAYKTYQNTGGHKYFASATAKATTANANIRLRANANDSTDTFNSTSWKTICAVYPTSSNGNLTVGVIDRRESGWDAIYVKDFTAIDLTLLLGTTIADYVYTLETATAGAGVAWLKKYFPKIFDSGYIPYNAGSMQHVTGLSASKTTGFNQWDEEWEVGTLSGSTGQPAASTTQIRSKNFCKCLPSTSYYGYCGFSRSYMNVFWYDADKNFISVNPFYNITNSPANAHYFKIRSDNQYGNTYKGDVCLHLKWDGERDGEYEPYEEHVYALPSDETYRGILNIDANGVPYADGDRKLPDGTVTRNFVNKVFVGAAIGEYWNLQSINEHDIANFGFGLSPDKYITGVSLDTIVRSNWYGDKVQTTLIANTSEEGILFASGDTFYVRISKSKASTVAEFKAYLAEHPLEIVYKLATPTTEEGTPYTEEQITNNWGTEELVSTTLVPVGHVTDYHPDLRAKVEVAPESPDTDGLYLMKRENGENSYVAYLGELPSDPSEDGTYTLKCTVASGTATKTWEADE